MLTTSHKIGKICGSLTFLYKCEFEDLSGVPTATYIYACHAKIIKNFKKYIKSQKQSFYFAVIERSPGTQIFWPFKFGPDFVSGLDQSRTDPKSFPCYSLIFNHTYRLNLFWAIKNTSFANDFHMQICEENISWIFDE